MPDNNLAYLDQYRAGGFDPDTNSVTIPQPDGGVVIRFGDDINDTQDDDDSDEDFYGNLADKIDRAELARISYDILEGVAADDRSRQQWISDRAKGMDLLALKIDGPKSDIGGSGAPLEGMATVRHPLLLEAVIKGSSNAQRELMPSCGPAKIDNYGKGTVENDRAAQQLQKDFNRFLMEFSPEYSIDTAKMFFDQYFSGMGFKKTYHCPLRRRPVSDTVPGQDLIVSNDATDLQTAQRVTHRQDMTQTTMRRMQYVGAYRDVTLMMPQQEPRDRVTQKQKSLSGVAAVQTSARPQDQQYLIYETQCFLDIRGFEHRDESGSITGLPVPWVVTIEKHSRTILAVRRDWEEDDEDALERRRTFVAYPFVPMFGFYATGLLHILGNTTTAVTGAWRIMLDSGMFASFPGFLYAKSGGRQDNLNFRIPPGGGTAVDLSGMDDIRKTIMALPYKEPGAATMQLVDNIANAGRQVGGSAELIDPSSIKQNMPVGTMMALVEQQAQTMSAVHERAVTAQSQELRQLWKLLREDPDALWRYIKDDGKWDSRETFVMALQNYGMVPVADPNTPSSVHRLMKNTALKQLATQSPDIYDQRAVDTEILESLDFDDPQRFFVPPPPPQAAPPSDAVVIAQATKEAKIADVQSKVQIEQMRLQHERYIDETDKRLKALELQLKDKQAGEANDTKIQVAEIAAHVKSEDREHAASLEHAKIAERVALHPFENHDKVLETKRTAPPKPKGSS